MNTPTMNYETILTTVRSWSASSRLKLVQDILQIMEAEIEAKPVPKNTLDQAYGLLKHSDQPAPSDEEVERWLEEERMKKYG